MLSTLQDWTGKWKQLKQWALHRSTGAPADIVEGGFYYDTTDKTPKYFDGSISKPFGQNDHALLDNLAVGDPHSQYILGTEIGVTIPPLSAGKIPTSYLPSYVDDVLEYANLTAFPVTGEASKIYVAIDTNKIYRWTGSAYGEISSSIALGETSATAYRGDRGAIAYTHSQTAGNPHGTTKSDLGITNATSSVYGLVQIEDTVINESTKAVTSNAVFNAIANIQSSTTYPAQAGSVSGAVSYNLLRFAFPYSGSYIYANIIIEISLFASDHPTDMGTMQILLSVSYEGGVFEYTASELYSTVATADRARIAFYDNSPTSKNVYIGFKAPSANRSFGARIVSNTSPTACSILYYTDSSTMGGDVAISQNSIISNKVNKTSGQTDWISASAVETILYIDGGIGFTILDGNGAYNGHVRYEVTSIGGVYDDAMYSAIIDLRIKNQYGVISYSGDLVSGSVNAFDNLWFRYDRVGGICYLTPIFRVNQWTTVSVRTLSEQGNIHSLSFNPTTTTSVSAYAARLNSPIIRNSGTYTQWVMTGTKGGYTGLSLAGLNRMNLMSQSGADIWGIYSETDSKWMLLRYPSYSEGITTDYPPPSNASGNQIATAGWVRGRLADTTVGNADKVDGYHIVCQSSFPSSPASNTIYFCY